MAFLTSATATATVAQNTNSVAVTGMDLNQVQPGMALYLGARDRAKGDGLIIAAVTPTGNSGGTIVLIGAVDAPYTSAAFLIDTIAYVGSGSILQLEADYQVLNALRTFGGTNTNLAGGNRQLWLDKKLASNVSYLALAIGSVLYGRLEQRTVAYTPTGGTTTTTEAISLRTSADGTILTDAIFVDTATGGVDALADSVPMVAAALTDLSSARKRKVTVTGTTAITSFGPGKHLERLITFQDAGLVLTHNATSLKLQGAANITTQAGDTCHATSDASGNWHVRSYARADGSPLVRSLTFPSLSISGSAGIDRLLSFTTNGSLRLALFCTADAETGGNAGSNLGVARYTDAGIFIDVPFKLSRSTGQVTLTKPLINSGTPAFFAVSGGDQTVAKNTYTLINAGAVSLNRGSAFNGSRFTAPVAGAYAFNGAIQIIDLSAAGVNLGAVIRVNGVDKVLHYQTITATLHTLIADAVLNLAAGDYVELWVSADNGGGSPVAQGTRTSFQGFFIS